MSEVRTYGRELRLVSRSTGEVTVDQFELVEVPVPEPAATDVSRLDPPG